MFCVCCATLPRPAQPESRSQQAQKLTAVKIGTICVHKIDPDNDNNRDIYSTWIGSGVIVDDYHVLTVNHVTDCSDGATLGGLYIRLYDGRVVGMKIAKSDKVADLALLERVNGDKIGIHVTPPVINMVTKHDIVCATTSFPDKAWSCGTVKDVTQDTVEISQNVEHGNSGSPMYNIQGNLVGIVTTLYTCDNEPCGGAAVSLWDHVDMMPYSH